MGKEKLDKKGAVWQYCMAHTSAMHPVQKKLIEETQKHGRAVMMGDPEVMILNSIFMRSIGAKRVLDIGVFTGASSLAAGLALPPDGEVIACDVSEEFTNIAKTFWAEAGVDSKIKLHLAPAVETLQSLLDQGQAGTFDFSFIDADKGNYSNYYELSLKLLRKGGIIVVDNCLWKEKVLDESVVDADTLAIRALNDKIGKDDRVQAVLLNIGDGTSIVTKL